MCRHKLPEMHPCSTALVAVLLLASILCFVNAQLIPNFYGRSCPNAESIVTSTIRTLSSSDNVIPSSTLRLFAHDCFVQGCDASILITSTPGNKAEQDSPENNIPTNAFSAVIKAKQAVESACPGVVSCADILALAARDVVVLQGGPTWQVPLGRRDGLVSQASLVAGHLPGEDFNVSQLVHNFAAVGLTANDLVVLSGAHTIGFSNCNRVMNRLYNFSAKQQTDPGMDPVYAEQLKTNCPRGGGGPVQALDVETPFLFDNGYYKDLQNRKGLLFSDQVLFNDNATRAMVSSLAASQKLFFDSFIESMIKMGTIGVKTGRQGEIRNDCTAFNT